MIHTTVRTTDRPRRAGALALVAAAVAGTAVGVVVATPAGAAAGCATGRAIGVMGPRSGAYRSLGLPIERGVELAVSRFNRLHPRCRVTVVRSDSQGLPAKASAAAKRLTRTPSVIGVVGPVFSGETAASGALFSRAGLATLSPSATEPSLTTHRWRTFFRGSPSDTATSRAAARWLVAAKKSRVCVVSDGTGYGAAAGAVVRRGLGSRLACTVTLRPAHPDYAAAVTRVKSAKADAVYFAGYDFEAVPLVRKLRAARSAATLVVGDGVYGPWFTSHVGPSGSGVVAVASIAPAARSAALAKRYRAVYHSAIKPYTAEAYDAANAFLNGIASGVGTRAGMRGYLHRYDREGIAQLYRFTSTGELAKPTNWVYVLRKGAFVSSGRLR
ncbi:branched-chain amino acid ABC transporter substrate-binding protein [Jatrophihabitans fulvus]